MSRRRREEDPKLQEALKFINAGVKKAKAGEKGFSRAGRQDPFRAVQYTNDSEARDDVSDDLTLEELNSAAQRQRAETGTTQGTDLDTGSQVGNPLKRSGVIGFDPYASVNNPLAGSPRSMYGLFKTPKASDSSEEVDCENSETSFNFDG